MHCINVTLGRMLLKTAQLETELLKTQLVFTSSMLTIVTLEQGVQIFKVNDIDTRTTPV